MKLVNLKDEQQVVSFVEAVKIGLGRNQGVFFPPTFERIVDVDALLELPFAERSAKVLHHLIGDELPQDTLDAMVKRAFNFPAKLVEVAKNQHCLELFHGPTLAFKDFAMQILGLLMDRALIKRGERATILGATSGDTGGAAIEAFRGREQIDIFILHPYGRVSDVQRRQMTTASEENVFNIALEGTFDDCQAMVKALFNDHEFRDGMKVTGVNSINWARIMAQIVYYFTAGVALGSPDRPLSFSVPTGNFGDVFAGFVAHKMGLPIEKLVVATNVNDILVRTLETGTYKPDGVTATYSPSMDIQVSSNFERLMFEMAGRDADRVVSLMSDLSTKGEFQLSENELAPMRELFVGLRIDESETVERIRDEKHDNDYIIDPHSAIALEAGARQLKEEGSVPMIALATAHPAKFPDVVSEATGVDVPQPQRLVEQLKSEERVERLANDLDVVSSYIAKNTRANGTA